MLRCAQPSAEGPIASVLSQVEAHQLRDAGRALLASGGGRPAIDPTMVDQLIWPAVAKLYELDEALGLGMGADD